MNHAAPSQKKAFGHILGQQYTVFDGLAGMYVEDIYQDRHGLLWIGTTDGGISRFDGAHFDTFGLSDGLPHLSVTAIDEDADGRLLFGTFGGGLAAYDGRGFQVYTTEHGLPSNEILGLQTQADSSVWVLTTAGVSRFVEGRCVECMTELAGQPLGVVYDIATDTEGTTWLATQGRGVLSMDGERMNTDSGDEHDAMQLQWPWNFAQDAAGNLWIAFRYVGTEVVVGRYDPTSKQFELIRVDDGAEGAEVVQHGTRHVRVDSRDRLWLSRRGVLVYDGEKWHPFSAGLPDVHFSDTRLTYEDSEGNLRDSQGRLWFGTRAGLIAYQPGETPPRIRIRQVVAGRTFDEPQAVSCPDSTPEIQFHFQGLSFRSGAEQMRYSHRLVGHSPAEEWSAFTPANRVTYQDVPAGLFHFEVRTVDRDGLMSDIARLEMRVVPTHLRRLEQMLRVSNQGFLSQSQAMARLFEQVESMAETDMTVLVLGETGVGKGVLTRLLHNLSPRQANPFIPVNCGGLSAGLIESELFGHEKGAFTSANAQKIGYFERANGGTLFLDEVGDLPLDSQRALLHILEEGHLTRVGGEQSIPVDVRVVAATNKDLEEVIQAGTFREDLFYRLSVLSVVLPPLRERQEDIPLLAAHFASRCAEQLGRPTPVLGEEVVAHLQQYAWPGNVRELEHVIQQAVVLGDRDVIQVADVPFQAAETELALPVEQGFVGDADDEDEKQRILAALQSTNWRIYGPRGAARLLGMGPEKLRYRMRKHGLQRPKKPSS